MAKQDKRPELDEQMLRDIVSSQSLNGSILSVAEEVAHGQTSTSAREAPPLAAPVPEPSPPVTEPRRRRIPIPDYTSTFLRNTEVKRRSVIYTSEDLKRKLAHVVDMLGNGELTVTAYVENILRNHLEIYGEEINRLHRERNFNNLI